MKLLGSLIPLALGALSELEERNQRPIIGIVSNGIQDHFENEENARIQGYTSYVSRNYVQTFEAAGARVVPIVYNADWETTKELLEKVNGIVYIGGGTNWEHFAKSRRIYEYVKNLNYQGHYVPIIGIC